MRRKNTRRNRRCRFFSEQLEPRVVLSATTANAVHAETYANSHDAHVLNLDVDGNLAVSVADAQRVINALDGAVTRDQNRLDVNGDRLVSPLDALLVINHLSDFDSAGAERASTAAGNDESRGYGTKPLPPAVLQQAKLSEKALEARARGHATDEVYEVAKGQFVELEREGVDNIFVLLAEFGDDNSVYGGAPGPLHNEIAEPDRTVDNITIWQPDYNEAHYEDMYDNQMADYFESQSSGRYSVQGDVQDWVQVDGNAARYGSNDCGLSDCDVLTWDLLVDTANTWYDQQIAAGRSPAEIEASLQEHDTWDRFDYDGDGNFDEPDGYIDHFQIVHAGEGEEAGGGAQGEDAIWSHLWYAFFQGFGSDGPVGLAQNGGFQIGDSNVWVGFYTIQPENGGLGVFAHEFAHDLGLPDLYNRAGPNNGSSMWTIMSAGTWAGPGLEDIGSSPIDMGAWEKFQLGWLNYEVSFAGEQSTHKLGPAETNTKQAQALFVVLPDRVRTNLLADPPEGNQAWYSDSGDDLDQMMVSQPFVVPNGASISAKMWFDIEQDWDYGYVMLSNDGGSTWVNLEGNVTTEDNPFEQNFGHGITGQSDGWVDGQFDIPDSYVGEEVVIGLRYWTDSFVTHPGILVDDLRVGDVFSSNAETGDEVNWSVLQWIQSDGTVTSRTFNAYLAEFRQYRDYDANLRTGPYQFSTLGTDLVEHFPNQDGLLIWYWDTYYGDNDVTFHPGEGMILPIDAHPEPLFTPAGTPWGSHVQMFDATFTREPTDEFSLYYADWVNGIQYGNTVFESQPGVTVFDDRLSYWSPDAPNSSVIVPNTGTQIIVRSESARGSFMQVEVRPANDRVESSFTVPVGDADAANADQDFSNKIDPEEGVSFSCRTCGRRNHNVTLLADEG